MSKRPTNREGLRQAIAKEAAYWDATDTSDLMAQETEWLTFESMPLDDRCDRCGAKMRSRQIDLHLSNGRVILRGVTWYICPTPGCGQTRLVPSIARLASQIETLVEHVLAAGLPELASTPPTQPARVQEDSAGYDSDKTDQR